MLREFATEHLFFALPLENLPKTAKIIFFGRCCFSEGWCVDLLFFLGDLVRRFFFAAAAAIVRRLPYLGHGFVFVLFRRPRMPRKTVFELFRTAFGTVLFWYCPLGQAWQLSPFL